jgi:acyl-CoA reductase-like NAD-dependent aldehyde dehydrogenase
MLVLLAKIVVGTSLRKGVFDVVTGPGSVVGTAVAAQAGVGLVRLTGSVESGIAVMRGAAHNVTKVSLELGGKGPAIVRGDADLELAVKAIRALRIINTAKFTTAPSASTCRSRSLRAFTGLRSAAMEHTVVGEPFDPAAEMGSLVSERQLGLVDAAVKRAVEEGSRVVTGGKRYTDRSGYYYPSTVFVDCGQKTDIMQREVFGPVLPIATFKDRDEAIDLGNGSRMPRAPWNFGTGSLGPDHGTLGGAQTTSRCGYSNFPGGGTAHSGPPTRCPPGLGHGSLSWRGMNGLGGLCPVRVPNVGWTTRGRSHEVPSVLGCTFAVGACCWRPTWA